MINIGNLTVKQMVHERICMLFEKLEGNQRDAVSNAQEAMAVGATEGREGLHKRLVDSLCAYEDLTGEVHEVDELLEGVTV